jgi:hypothetical protein
MMVPPMKRVMTLLGATALLLLAFAAEVEGVAIGEEPYDPAADQSYASSHYISPEVWQAVWGLVREFESGGRSRTPGAVPLPQPQPSAYSNPPDAPPSSHVAPGALAYGQPYYGLSPYSAWAGYPDWQESLRIPWWALIPHSRDKDRHDYDHAHGRQDRR